MKTHSETNSVFNCGQKSEINSVANKMCQSSNLPIDEYYSKAVDENFKNYSKKQKEERPYDKEKTVDYDTAMSKTSNRPLLPEEPGVLIHPKSIDNDYKNGMVIEEWKMKNGSKLQFYSLYSNNIPIDCGIGIIIEKDENNSIKSIYKGEFQNKKANGYGYYKDDSEEYEGEWSNNEKNGLGEIKYADNSSYKGEFLNGKRNGIGEYKWSDNSYYKGEFKNNNMNGYGICRNANNVVFMGKFSNGLLNGYGEIRKPNGTTYFGGFIEGKKNGYGILITFTNSIKSIYFGFFKSNMMDGFGKKVTKNTETYGFWNMGCQQEKYEESHFFISLKAKGLQKYAHNFKITYSEFDAIYLLNLNN